jgi:hypothetical protein
MHKLWYGLFLLFLVACQSSPSNKIWQNKIDSLEKKLAKTYTPGFGEFMSNIQVHHAKLWFAGQNQNWRLADFELHEIKETLEAIQQYQTRRKESEKVPILYPALDNVDTAIQHQNKNEFTRAFVLLTNTCNNCHQATNFEFNVVTIPHSVPFTNQDFKLKQ